MASERRDRRGTILSLVYDREAQEIHDELYAALSGENKCPDCGCEECLCHLLGEPGWRLVNGQVCYSRKWL